jgi:hypothetical protein
MAGLSGGVYLAARAGMVGESLNGAEPAAADRRVWIECAVWATYATGLGAALLWWWRIGRRPGGSAEPRWRRRLRRAAVTVAATPVVFTPFLLAAGQAEPRPPAAALVWEAGGWLMFTWVITLFTALLIGVRAVLVAGVDVLTRYSDDQPWADGPWSDPATRRRHRLARISHLALLPFAIIGLPVWAVLQIDSDLIPEDLALALLAPLVLAWVGWAATGGLLALMERRPATRRH